MCSALPSQLHVLNLLPYCWCMSLSFLDLPFLEWVLTYNVTFQKLTPLPCSSRKWRWDKKEGCHSRLFIWKCCVFGVVFWYLRWHFLFIEYWYHSYVLYNIVSTYCICIYFHPLLIHKLLSIHFSVRPLVFRKVSFHVAHPHTVLLPQFPTNFGVFTKKHQTFFLHGC